MQYIPPPIVFNTSLTSVPPKPDPEVFDPIESPDEPLARTASDILSDIYELEPQADHPVTVAEIWEQLGFRGYNAKFRGMGRTLNGLRRAGYIIRVRRGTVVGYRMTDKGHAWAAQ